MIDELDPFDPYEEDDEGITCIHCGEEGLHWDDKESEDWQLHDQQNQLHMCLEYDDEGFEALEDL